MGHRGYVARNDLVPTGVAAQAIGVTRKTLNRWWDDGLVKPEVVTPGGHGRWDIDKLRKQLENLQERDEEDN